MQEASLVRKMFFGAYGALIGAGYGQLAASYFQLDSQAIAASTIIAAVLLSVLAVAISDSPRPAGPLTTFQRLVMISLAPLVLAAGVFGMGVIIGWLCCVLPFVAIASFRQNRQFRQRMADAGRYSRLQDLRPQLLLGEGTLIEELDTKGTCRIWWTADVLENAPVSLTRDDYEAALNGRAKDSFNARCLDQYLDEEKGIAQLTSISPRLATTGELSRKFPNVKRAVVFRPF